jgi:hypothetical protein
MAHDERRQAVQSLLEGLAEQRDVDLRVAVSELIHLVFELDDEARQLEQRVSRLERGGPRAAVRS